MAITLCHTAFLEAIQNHKATSTVIVDFSPEENHSYGSLLNDVAHATEQLLAISSGKKVP